MTRKKKITLVGRGWGTRRRSNASRVSTSGLLFPSQDKTHARWNVHVEAAASVVPAMLIRGNGDTLVNPIESAEIGLVRIENNFVPKMFFFKNACYLLLVSSMRF